MNDTKYIGLDVHQATIPATVLDSAGKLMMKSILATDAQVPERPTSPANSRLSRVTGCLRLDITRLRSVPGTGTVSLYFRCEPSADPPRSLIVHSLRLERLLLSARHEAVRLPPVLCRTISHRRGGLDLLRMSSRLHG